MKNIKKEDLDFLYDPKYAEKVCARAYEENKEMIDEIIKLLEKK